MLIINMQSLLKRSIIHLSNNEHLLFIKVCASGQKGKFERHAIVIAEEGNGKSKGTKHFDSMTCQN